MEEEKVPNTDSMHTLLDWRERVLSEANVLLEMQLKLTKDWQGAMSSDEIRYYLITSALSLRLSEVTQELKLITVALKKK
jgi:hypothetical protein